MNLLGTVLVLAVISVVPGFFLWLFANSARLTLRKLHEHLLATEQAAQHPAPAETPGRNADLLAARAAYNERRRTFWGWIWGTVCRLPRGDRRPAGYKLNSGPR